MKKTIIISLLGLSLLGSTNASAMTMFEKPPFENYQVSKGDSFSFIANRYGLNTKELMALNPEVDPSNMQVGSTIRLMPEKEVTPVTQTKEELVQSLANKIIATGLSIKDTAQYADLGKQDDSKLLFRCASYIHYIFKQNGIELGTKSEDEMYKMGEPVEKADLQRGDLIFLDGNHDGNIEHVGIYIGDNKMLHMANHELDVEVSDLDRQYYKEGYYGAVRIIPSYIR